MDIAQYIVPTKEEMELFISQLPTLNNSRYDGELGRERKEREEQTVLLISQAMNEYQVQWMPIVRKNPTTQEIYYWMHIVPTGWDGAQTLTQQQQMDVQNANNYISNVLSNYETQTVFLRDEESHLGFVPAFLTNF